MTHLATVYRELGMTKEAELILRDVIKIYGCLPSTSDRCLEDKGLLMSMNELAITYGDQEQWSKKEELEREIIDKFIEVEGENHPHTLSAMNNLAQTYRMQGHAGKAAEMLPSIIKRKITVLGPEHPDTLSSMSSLAHLHWEQNRREEALNLQADVFNTSKRTRGEGHLTTLTHMINLAEFLMEMDREPEAMSLLETCADLRSLQLGEKHPETVYARLLYKDLYEEQLTLQRLIGIDITPGQSMPMVTVGLANATTWPEDDGEAVAPEVFEAE